MPVLPALLALGLVVAAAREPARASTRIRATTRSTTKRATTPRAAPTPVESQPAETAAPATSPIAPPPAVSPPAPTPAAVAAPAVPRPTIRDIPLPPPPQLAPPRLHPVEPAGSMALRVAVPWVHVQGKLEPRQASVVQAAIVAELQKLEGVSAYGASVIRELLSADDQRRLTGCDADESCLAEVGAAIGTEELLRVSVSVEGKSATLSAKRIGVRTRLTVSEQRRLTGARGGELLAAVGPLVQAVFPDRALRPGRTRGAGEELVDRLDPPPLPRWPFFATAGAAVAAAAGGVAFGLLAQDARDQYDSIAARSLDPSVSGPALRDLDARAVSRARTANYLFVAAGVLGVAAGVEAFFTDWHGYRAAVEVAPDAAAVKFERRF
jgi:hypothetical protein